MRRALSSAFVMAVATATIGRSPTRRVTSSAAPPTITITAREYAFDAPDSIAAGPTTIRLLSQGRELHVLQFIRIASGHTVSDFTRSLSTHEDTPWITRVGGVGTVAPDGAAMVTLALTPGSYVMFCDIPDTHGTPHMMKGMLRPLTVFARGTAATMPLADVALDLGDYVFTLSSPLSMGRHVVAVRNLGTQTHMALLWQLHRGKSVTDVVQWMNGGPGPSPVTVMGGVPDLDRSQEAQMVLHLVPGRYVLICLDDDVHDHKPHYAHGMVRELTILSR